MGPCERSWSEDFDICIVQLDAIPAAPALPIDRSNSQHAGTNAVVVGWGALREGGGSPDVHQEALLPVLGDGLCAQLYGSEYTGNLLCAGYLQGGIDAFHGDSGGPLVSTGVGCARVNAPGVYAQVNEFDDWLCETTGNGIEASTSVAQTATIASRQQLLVSVQPRYLATSATVTATLTPPTTTRPAPMTVETVATIPAKMVSTRAVPMAFSASMGNRRT